jgi:hypothetical protein
LSALAESLRRFEPSWLKVGRIHRHICFLRLEGRQAEAREIEHTELAPAVADARKTSESEAEADAVLHDLTHEDEARVADAVAFAEVLVPMLSDRLKLQSPSLGAPARGPRQKRPEAGNADESHGIADFIDEMLAQERAAPH